jgi:CO/xanthine dehydrogenase Mo-binding subunit
MSVDVERREGIGVSRPRTDAIKKLTGASSYASDREFVGLLHARLVLSPYAHARILGIDGSSAIAIAGVRAVLTAADLPIKGEGGRWNEPLAREEVVFAGQPVVLVVAESEAAAADGAEAVVVDYDELPVVVDVEAALRPDSPLTRLGADTGESDAEMHGAAGSAETPADEDVSANVSDSRLLRNGDADAGFAGCDEIVEGQFRTSWVHQTHLEPQVAVAWPTAPDGVSIYTSTQGIFFVRDIVSRVYGIEPANVVVEGATLGGGFGAKIGLVEPLVVGAALAVGRPVRLAFTRTEDFAAANPAPAFVIDLKIGARSDGTFVALRSRVLVDGGAFADSAPTALVGGRVSGPYRWQDWHVQVYGVRTNRFGPGAYRGPTATQCAFALETLVDELAAKLDIDPLELRRMNAAGPGEERFDGSSWPPIGFTETLDAIEQHPLWARRRDLPPNEGVGFATGFFPGGKMGAGAVCRLDTDGGLTVVTGYVDMTGTETTVASIAADTFGVPAERVRVVASSSAGAPISGVTGGSMVTYCLGLATARAAEDARTQLLDRASRWLKADASELDVEDGEVLVTAEPDRRVAVADIAARVNGFGSSSAPVEGHAIVIPPEIAPSVAAALIHVRVDPDTGRVEIVDWVAAQDVGHALNPALCEGQMRGGATQSLGYALFEELAHDEDGRLLSGSLLNYTVPRFDTTPEIETILVEVPSAHGPLGAKGIGESAIVPGAAAIANAIAAATGRRPRHLPITPERLWRLLQSTPA